MRAFAIALLFCGSAAAEAPPAPDDEPLRRELSELRAKQRELERRLDALQAPPRIEPSPLRFSFGRGGFVFGTTDGKSEVRLRVTLQVDGRAYFGPQSSADTFLIRRARPFIDGTLFDLVDFRIMPDFAQGKAELLDAYLELRPWRWLRLRAGRFMVPIGLEWLKKDTTITFVERSLATDLVPYRDLGVMLNGDVGDGTFCYAIGIFNGAPDSSNGPDLDPQTSKDYVGRIFLRPLRRYQRADFMDLGFGVAGSYGSLTGTGSVTNLPSYRSPGQLVIFSYLNNPTVPDSIVLSAGDRWRVTPQLYLYLGPVGLLGEYVVSSQRVQRPGLVAELQNQAWNLTLSFVMTLERLTFDGVVPKHPVDFRHKAFGAFELTLRYSELRIDDQAFPNFADAAVSVRQARELAAGLNWYLTDYFKFMLSFHRTDYQGGAPAGGHREPENALLGRLQVAL